MTRRRQKLCREKNFSKIVINLREIMIYQKQKNKILSGIFFLKLLGIKKTADMKNSIEE